MSKHPRDEAKEAKSSPDERREFRSYLWGAAIALLLTLVSFSLIHNHGLHHGSKMMMIGVFALLQILVHFRFFLHITFAQKREDLLLILFSAFLLSVMVIGTIWIMASLMPRMMMPH